MIKKSLSLIILVLVFIISGCSKSKQELLDENTRIINENKEFSTQNQGYKEIRNLFDFYNELSVETLHSFVLIESKHVYTSKTTYSDGVVVASNGYDYYVLTDYNKLWVSDNIQYRVMNANAEVYSAYLIRENNKILYDEETGMVLLRIRVGHSSGKMQTINFGNVEKVNAIVTNVEQLNKIELIEQLDADEYFYKYEDLEYSYYKIMSKSAGSIVNMYNKICGFYLSNLQGYASGDLIKKVAYATYSLIL